MAVKGALSLGTLRGEQVGIFKVVQFLEGEGHTRIAAKVRKHWWMNEEGNIVLGEIGKGV